MTKIVSLFYKFLFYFELGKGNTARFYQFIPDIIIILGGLKYLLNFNVTPTFTIIFAITAITAFFFIGYIINKTGLYEVEKKVQMSKDPVMREIYNAALKTNKKS